MYTAAIGRHVSPVSHRHYATAALEASLLARVHRAKTARVIDGRGHVTRVAALSRVPAGRRSAHRNPDWGTVSEVQLRDAMLTLDAGAWREFHKRYDALIAGAAGKVVSKGRNASDAANEVKGNVYAALLENDMHKLRLWEPGRGHKLGSFVYMIATRAAIDYGRSSVRSRWKSGALEEGYDPASPLPSADRIFAAKADVRRVFSALTANEREFAEAAFWEGLSPEELSERFGLTLSTAYTKTHRVKKRIEELLGAQ